MLKKLLLVVLFVSSLYSMTYSGLDQSIDKDTASQEAHWKAFELALEELADSKGYLGKIHSSFRSDFEKDFSSFKRVYMNTSMSRCQDLGNDGFVCKVQVNINIKKLRAHMNKKSNSSTVMGKSRMKKVNIVLIDNVSNSVSKDLVNMLHKYIGDSGHSLLVLPKGTPVGRKGNKCDALEDQKKYFKRKGSSYSAALKATIKRLKECKENKSVEYAFKLEKVNFKIEGKDTYDDLKGSLKYKIIMINSQTGKRNQSISAMLSNSVGENESILKNNLYVDASQKITKEINNNVLTLISNKQDNKRFSKFDKFDYMYTIKLVGLTGDRDDRSKIKIAKDIVKKYGSKLRKNRAEGDDFHQVYNFGSNDEIDLEELSYDLYDIADSIGMQIKVSDEADDILAIQFQ